jgi:CRISPR-associated RAMP protein (TIGR02581 family)
MTNKDRAQVGPGMAGFESRLELRGRLILDTALRVGAGRTQDVAAPDLPVVKTVDDRPYVPGSSFKGAWRAFSEMVLRTVQDQPEVRDTNLACLSVSKRDKDSGNGRCLTAVKVQELKAQHQGAAAELSQQLRDESCWVCRVFGAQWLASKILVRDLPVSPETFGQMGMRDGVAIDRDTGRVSGGRKYQFEAVPANTEFDVEIVIENASPAELGLAWLGLRAMEKGMISLGGARSRGLGRCRFVPAWEDCRYVTGDDLLDYLFEQGGAPDDEAVWQERMASWVEALKTAIGVAGEAQDE